jgi:hypothetical protein
MNRAARVKGLLSGQAKKGKGNRGGGVEGTGAERIIDRRKDKKLLANLGWLLGPTQGKVDKLIATA